MAITSFQGFCGLIRSVVGFSISELSGSGYARQPVSFSLISNQSNQLQNANIVNFTAGGSDWGNFAYFGFWDSATLGNLIFYAPQTFQPNSFNFYISAGQTITLPIGFFTWDLYDQVQKPYYPFGTTLGISTNSTGAVPVLTGSPVVNVNGVFLEANLATSAAGYLGAFPTTQRPPNPALGGWYFDLTLGRPMIYGPNGWINFIGGSM